MNVLFHFHECPVKLSASSLGHLPVKTDVIPAILKQESISGDPGCPIKDFGHDKQGPSER